MNAIKLYVSAARLVLENERYSPGICNELDNMLSNLKQSLSCTVCRNILRDPHSPIESFCQHYVCKLCIGGLKILRLSCSWCKDCTKYERNTQLQSLLTCFLALCDYVKCLGLLSQQDIPCNSFESSENISNLTKRGKEILNNVEIPVKNEIIDQCDPMNDQLYRFCDDDDDLDTNTSVNDRSTEYKYINGPPMKIKRNQSRLSSMTDSRGKRRKVHVSHSRRTSESTNSVVDKLSDSTSDELDSKATYSVSFTGTRSKIILKRKRVTSKLDSRTERKRRRLKYCRSRLSCEPLNPSQQSSAVSENLRFRKVHSSFEENRPRCRCGTAAPKPGNLTCCGQRCPCYMRSKTCQGCKCKGCRNPHMIDGVKVLGRYAKEVSMGSNLRMDDTHTFQDMDVKFLNHRKDQTLPEVTSTESVSTC